MKSLFDLSGKTAIVTGASGGLGRGIALALANAGADIVTVDRTACDITAAAVKDRGRRCHTICPPMIAWPTLLRNQKTTSAVPTSW